MSSINDNDDNQSAANAETIGDLYEMLASIDTQFHYGDTAENRTDAFKIGFEKLFNLDVDKIDEVEVLISERNNAEELRAIYNEIRSSVCSVYDKYLGIKFNYDDINRSADLQEIYSVYRIMFIDLIDWVAKVFAYINKRSGGSYDINRYDVYEDFMADLETFNLDTIPQILSEMDPGNIDYELVFGEVPEMGSETLISLNKVSIDFDTFVKHFRMEMKLGAGVTNTSLLRKKIEFYSKYIDENHII